MEHDGRLMLELQLPRLEDAARRLPGAGRAPALCVLGGDLWRLGLVSRGAGVRAAAQRLRLVEAALRQRRARAPCRPRRRRSPAFATSTSTARASSTRAAWPRSRSTISSSGRRAGRVKLFGEYGGYAAGEQKRDFVFVDDVVAVNLWFLAQPAGQRHLQPRHRPGPALQRRRARRRQCRPRGARRGGPRAAPIWSAQGLIEYVDFPPALVGKYQCFTEADLARLRAVGCDHAFADVASGVARYVDWLRAAALKPSSFGVNPEAAAAVTGGRYVGIRLLAAGARIETPPT